MRNYTTLGDGKATKVIATTEHQPARTVTTCPAPAAAALARALQATDRKIAAALYPVAVDLDGTPVQARRQLLALFDQVVTGTPAPPAGTPWGVANALVAAVADAVRDLPAPVVKAARAELATHLDGLDGVLVPARATSDAHRAGVLDLVITASLHRFGQDWWTSLVASGPFRGPDDEIYPVGGHIVDAPGELYDITQDLYDAEPATPEFHLSSMDELHRAGDDGHLAYLIVAARLMDAYAAHHHPELSPLPWRD